MRRSPFSINPMPKIIDDPIAAGIEACKKTVEEYGDVPFGMEEIAARAGVSVSLLYSKIGGLSSLLRMTLIRLWKEEIHRRALDIKGCRDYSEFLLVLLDILEGFQQHYECHFSKIKRKEKEELSGFIHQDVSRIISSNSLSFGCRLSKDDTRMLADLLLWKAGKKGRSTVF